MLKRRRAMLGVTLGLCVAVLSFWAIWSSLAKRNAQRIEAELRSARSEIGGGFHASALVRLQKLAQEFTVFHVRDAEIPFQLGNCELALGRPQAALDAWLKVPAGAPPWSAQAAATAATLNLNTGRYTKAEQALDLGEADANDPVVRFALQRARSRLYRFEGRVDDVRRVLRSTFGDAEDRPAILKELYQLDNSAQPVESWQRALEVADPNDDRVWLGRAVVATLTGQFAEAKKRLDDCEKLHPDDPCLWRTRLDLAMATDDPSGVWQAARKIPLDFIEPGEPAAVVAWLAQRGNDREFERKALRALVAIDPARAQAIDRLALLEFEAGRRTEADALHKRKAEIDQIKDRVRKVLLSGDDLVAAAPQLAADNEKLGRHFDAIAWQAITDPNKRSSVPVGNTNKFSSTTLADKLSEGGLREPKGDNRIARVDPLTRIWPTFVDDATKANLVFTFENGKTDLMQLPETMSGGVGVLDFDGDGWLDVYVVQGGPVGPESITGPVLNGDKLFRNKHDGTFEDVTQSSGISKFARDYGMGVTVGDYDNDGRPDLFLTRLRSYALYHNEGNGKFRDVTESVGLKGSRDNPTSAAFADLDNDGDLDLYVCHYMVWDPANPRLCKNDKGGYFYCDPSKVDAAKDHLFRNDGGKFVDITKEAGIVDVDGRGLGVVATDLDGDGKVDLYVANDGTANFYFHNLGNLHFEEIGLAAGVAAGEEGGFQASMGVACGDYNGDGLPDLVVSNFYGESSTLYRNLGKGFFQNETSSSGLGKATRYLLGFGCTFADFDDDGRLDLATVNGHVNDNRPYYPYAMPAQLLLGSDSGRFVDATSKAGEVWTTQRVGRGLAVVDLDNDGLLDALFLAQNEPLVYAHAKRGPNSNASITIQLEGKKSNRDGIGATIVVMAGGRKQVVQRFGGGSYQSAADPRIHIGIGENLSADSIEVRWPSGQVDKLANLKANQGYRVVEGSNIAVPLVGFLKP